LDSDILVVSYLCFYVDIQCTYKFNSKNILQVFYEKIYTNLVLNKFQLQPPNKVESSWWLYQSSTKKKNKNK